MTFDFSFTALAHTPEASFAGSFMLLEHTRCEDETLLHDSVSGYLRSHYDDAERRRIIQSEPGWSTRHWKAFTEDLGLLGAGFAEKLGGLGGGAAAQSVIMEQFGRALVVEPYLETVVVGGGLLKYGEGDRNAEMISGIIAGAVTIAFACAEPTARYDLAHVKTRATRTSVGYSIEGRKSVVLTAPWATHLIVAARTGMDDCSRSGISLFLVDANAPGLERRDYKTISGREASDIELRGVAIPRTALLAAEGEALPIIERVIDDATAMICSEAVGILSRLYGDTVSYTQQRHQFGRALASFQVLQHRMVDMLIAIEHSTSIAERAIAMLGESTAERAKAVSAAKVFVGKALRFVGQQAIQLHDGMGLTDELALGYFFKRAIEIERQFGSIDYHLARYERIAYGRSGVTRGAS